VEPFIALVFVTLVARLAGHFGLGPFKTLGAALAPGAAALFVMTGVAHFVHLRDDLVRMVPPSLGHAEFWVSFTGVAELCGAAGILLPRTRRWAAVGLALLLVAVFPANVYAITHGVTFGGGAPESLLVRALEQVVFLAAVLAAGFAPRVASNMQPAAPEGGSHAGKENHAARSTG